VGVGEGDNVRVYSTGKCARYRSACVCASVCLRVRVCARVAPVAGGPGSGPMACGPRDGGGGDGVPSVWFASGP